MSRRTGVNSESDLGEAGASAQAEYERRRARHDKTVRDRWGTGMIGKIAARVIDEPNHTSAWAKGAVGEREFARQFQKHADPRWVVLHDRAVPDSKANIDHLVVGPSGIWVVDAKRYKGKIERRDCGSWRTKNMRLFVNGRDRSKLVDAMVWQEATVLDALTARPGDVPVHTALCFIDGQWPVFAKAAPIDGVWITTPRRLAALVAESEANNSALLDDATIQSIAAALAAALPPSSCSGCV